jgi:hypothetical protein
MTDIELLTNVLTAGIYVSYIETACDIEVSKTAIKTLAELVLSFQGEVARELAARIGIDSDELKLRSDDIHNMIMRQLYKEQERRDIEKTL